MTDWLAALAELQGKEHELADEMLEKLRAAMRQARSADRAAPPSGRQQQRVEAQRRKAEACRLKKQRALAQAAQEATKAAGDGEGKGYEEADTDVAATKASDEMKAEAAAKKEEAECSICLLQLGEAGGGIKMLGCGHVYHAGCIAEWVDTCRRKELTLECQYFREQISV